MRYENGIQLTALYERTEEMLELHPAAIARA